ncbi:MAG: trypsin-like peptidase domain-containing protein [Chloroflexota bacterium]
MLIIILVTPTLPIAAAPPYQEGFNVAKALRATVSVTQVFTNSRGQVVISCVGSGTLVSVDGLILTNAHIALPSPNCRSDKLVISLTVRTDEAPVAKYYAQTVGSNLGWDLAVLRVTSTLDGKPVDRATLNLPFAEIGDSEATQLDDTINVVGYAISGDKASNISQLIRATVAGVTAEALVGDRAWLKTSAAIPGSMSGGGAYNVDGKLIGIPTVEPTVGTGDTLNCRRVQDSNGDNRVDDKDICIPISGLINALRPSRLARGLILAAGLGITPSIRPPTQPEPDLTDPPTFSRLFFSAGVNQAGMPSSVVTGVPSGTKRLYLFFDYDNMKNGTVYELRTTLDGVPNVTFSLAPATWSGGRRGLWYIGSTAQIWPNGTYDFSLYIEGVRTANKQITIGGPARQDPIFTDVLFGVVPSDSDQLVNTGNLIPIDSPNGEIHAEFIYNNVPPNTSWRQVWYYEGLKLSENTDTWKDPVNGKKPILAQANPLKPGRYRLELYLGDQMAATSDFIVAGKQSNLPLPEKNLIFKDLSFVSEVKNNAPVGAKATAFTSPIQGLYASFNWQALGEGTPWTWRWTVDNNPLFEVTQSWNDAADGAAEWLGFASQSQVVDGSYKLELLVSGVVMSSAIAKVGLGQLPPTTFGVAQGVQVQGRITDAENGRGISGVTFIVIKVDFDTHDFVWDMSQVYDLSFSDADGQYTVSKLLALEKDKAYSIIVLARGYLPVTTDGLQVTEKTKSPLILNIALSRD